MTIGVGDLSFSADIAGPADGPAVLFLHGFPQSRRSWSHQVKTLAAAGYCCVAPDQRGYSPGARPSETEAYAATRLVGDALGIMEVLGR
jgi:pimeloyl-ACP methyl ester carboxylesterase